MIRTPAGLVLERPFQSMHDWQGFSLRYLLCYNGQSPTAAYDCACCITWPDDELFTSCGCPCHQRIEKMAQTGDIPLLFFALSANDDLPRFPKSLDEEKKWREQAIKDGKAHYHTTNGEYAGYPLVSCGHCPEESSSRAIFNTTTGEPFREHFPAKPVKP